MGSIGDGDDEIQPVKLNSSMDDCENETQPFDSEKLKDQDFDEFQFQPCTLPMVDTVPLEDAFETQAINLAGETDVLDDPNGLVNVGARLLGDCDYGVVDSDGEGSDKTEVLDDSAELSDDDFTKRVGSCLVDQENKLCSSISKQEIGGFEAELDGLDIEVQSAGSEQKNFTSVHAASLRACSVAVRSMAFKGNSDEPSPVKSDIQSSKQHTSEVKEIACIRNSSVLGVEVELEDLSGERNEQIKGSGTVNKCRIGTTVGRLFLDDALGEIEGPDNGTDNAVLPHLPACGDEAAGLSYVDSQEPGELSQDNALNFVDRFLKFNVMDFDQEGDIGRSSGGKSKPISITKGTQSLAKITNLISTAGERGSFDWDDSREDEGGGEFFTKKKEALFDDGGGRRKRSCTKYQKLKNYSKGWGAVDETSDKGIVLQNSKRNDRKVNIIETKSKMNVIKELKEHLENVVPGGIDATGTDKDMPEMLNVGLDTQMAAEAMEALCFGLDVANCDNKDTNDGTKNISEGSCRGEKWNRAWSKTYARRKRSSSVKDCHLQGKAGTFTPIACQTRQQSVTNPFRAGIASYDSGKASTLNSKQSGELETVTEQLQSYQKLSDAAVGIGECRRTRRKLSGQLNGSSNPNGLVNQIVEQENSRQSREESNRPKTNALKRKNRASKYDGPVLSAVDKGVSGCAAFECCYDDGIVYPKDMVGALASKLSDRQSDADTISAGGNTKLEVLPVDKFKSSGSVSGTPINCITPVSAVSPICEGDLKQSSRKNLSRSFLVREINSLFSNCSEGTSTIRDSRRRRREMANVRVLFSHHLNGDIIKQQKKILARLGASVASSISETTHFVTDEFVRTRNMLEAIAFGKPVVTHLWLESCGQAGCFIDERTYILRDAKKEKEFGFSLPLSLARASRCPLLQGQKVLITPNTKPGKELLVGLVKAVHGQALERIGRSAFKAGEIPDGLLVLSCEEDYATCAPFLEKGAAVYSSELLLNGIVTQKLEYERHRLFVDRIKKTRSRKRRSLSACD